MKIMSRKRYFNGTGSFKISLIYIIKQFMIINFFVLIFADNSFCEENSETSHEISSKEDKLLQHAKVLEIIPGRSNFKPRVTEFSDAPKINYGYGLVNGRRMSARQASSPLYRVRRRRPRVVYRRRRPKPSSLEDRSTYLPLRKTRPLSGRQPVSRQPQYQIVQQPQQQQQAPQNVRYVPAQSAQPQYVQQQPPTQYVQAQPAPQQKQPQYVLVPIDQVQQQRQPQQQYVQSQPAPPPQTYPARPRNPASAIKTPSTSSLFNSQGATGGHRPLRPTEVIQLVQGMKSTKNRAEMGGPGRPKIPGLEDDNKQPARRQPSAAPRRPAPQPTYQPAPQQQPVYQPAPQQQPTYRPAPQQTYQPAPQQQPQYVAVQQQQQQPQQQYAPPQQTYPVSRQLTPQRPAHSGRPAAIDALLKKTTNAQTPYRRPDSEVDRFEEQGRRRPEYVERKPPPPAAPPPRRNDDPPPRRNDVEREEERDTMRRKEESNRSFKDTLAAIGATEFLDLVDSVDLTDELEYLQDVTGFIPSNGAIEKLPAQLLDALAMDPGALRDVLMYHVARGQAYRGDSLKDNMLLTPYNATAQKVRVNTYHTTGAITANCVRMSMKDVPGRDLYIHVIDEFLIPPAGDMFSVLQASESFTTLSQLLVDAGLDLTLTYPVGPLTMAAPTDSAFLKMDQLKLARAMSDIHKLRKLLLVHILPGAWCCDGIMNEDHKSLADGITVRVRQSLGRVQFSADSSRAVSLGTLAAGCDQVGSNGVIIPVNNVLMPDDFN